MFDMSLEEIAELLATTPGAVKSALHRGRDRLREADDAASRRPMPSPELLDRWIERYRAKDLNPDFPDDRAPNDHAGRIGCEQ
jgi:RNA polymerase sigma-70 factor (ECF subfamily)